MKNKFRVLKTRRRRREDRKGSAEGEGVVGGSNGGRQGDKDMGRRPAPRFVGIQHACHRLLRCRTR